MILHVKECRQAKGHTEVGASRATKQISCRTSDIVVLWKTSRVLSPTNVSSTIPLTSVIELGSCEEVTELSMR